MLLLACVQIQALRLSRQARVTRLCPASSTHICYFLLACRYKLSVCLDRLGSHVCAQRRVRAGICPCEHHVFALQTQNDPTIVEVSGATPSHLAEHACSATATCFYITFLFFASLYTRTRAHTHSRSPPHTDTYSLARSFAHGSHHVTRRHKQPFTLVYNICPTNAHTFHPTCPLV
jgi:hypothetical protein